jgi:hypothetical protein
VAETGDRIAYEREVGSGGQQSQVRLSACRTAQSYPHGSGASGWELELENRLREVSSTRSIGHTSSRPEAVRSLFDAMRAVNDAMRSRAGDGDRAIPLGPVGEAADRGGTR